MEANKTRVTTKNRIKSYLIGRGVVSGTELESQAEYWETKASVISRRARELARDGEIDRLISNRGTVGYAMPDPTGNGVLL